MLPFDYRRPTGRIEKPKSKVGRIDKSALAIPEDARIRDRNWLDAHHAMTCWVPGCATVGCDPAHVRAGQGGGTGLKPSDDLVYPLCHAHHSEQHGWPGGEENWWIERVIKPAARKRYERWKTGA